MLVMLAVTLAYVRERMMAPPKPPRAGAAVAGKPDALPVIAELAPLGLTNQLGQPVGLADLRDKVWLVDIIFTRCPGPCATMTRRMAEIAKLVRPDLPVGFLTLTTDPDFDTPAVLRQYAERHGADTNRWHFLTGDKPAIARAAAESFKLVAREKAEETRTSPNDLFIHSTVFALVDKRGRLRGVVETVAGPVEEGEPAFVDPWETEYKPKILRALQQLILEE